MRKELTQQEFNALGLSLTEFQQRDIELKKQSYALFNPFAEIVQTYTVIFEQEKPYFQHSNLYLNYKGHLLQPFKYHGDTGYTFMLKNSNPHNIEFRNKKEKPNKVGKPTEKKLDDWLNYLLDEEEQIAQKNKEIEANIQEFREQLKGLHVNWQNTEHTRGFIFNDDFEITFNIDRRTGYISQQMRMRFAQTIENFKRLSNGSK